MEKPPYQQDGVYILARGNKEYHIAKIIGNDETSNPGSVGNASTRCLRYYKSYEYSIADREPQRDQVCRKCQSKRYQRTQ